MEKMNIKYEMMMQCPIKNPRDYKEFFNIKNHKKTKVLPDLSFINYDNQISMEDFLLEKVKILINK
jgi:hypothetical protein